MNFLGRSPNLKVPGRAWIVMAVVALLGLVSVPAFPGKGGEPHNGKGQAILRRLNRVEYENTMRDLLAVDVDLQEMLPMDTSANGL